MNDLMAARTLDVRGIQLRDGKEGDGRTIEGIAVPFGVSYDLWDDYSEMFDRDTDFGERTVKLAREHGELIGRVEHMEARDDGLHVTARLSDTTAAREAADLIRDGVYDAFSVGFRPKENLTVTDDDGHMTVHRRKVDLYEISVTGIPAYPAAQIQSQRTTTSKEDTMPTTTEETARMDALDAQLRDIKTKLVDMQPAPAPAVIGSQYRSAGEYLKAMAVGDEQARDVMKECRDLIVTGDTGNTVTWIADDLRLIEQRRKVMNILTHDTLPPDGMHIDYNVVTSDTSTVAKQQTEGSALSFGKVGFGTKSADIALYGGYTTLSRQVIERSTTPMLNTALRALTNAYAKSTENSVRAYFYSLIKSQRDADSDANKIDAAKAVSAMTPNDWASLILDAAEIMDDRNASLTRLAVSKDVAKALIALTDSGNRFIDISGKGSDTIGSFDLTGVVGDLMRVPVYILPKAEAGTAAFVDPQCVTVWESGGPTQLSDGDITKLTDSYSVYGYMAMGATFIDGLLPIKFKA